MADIEAIVKSAKARRRSGAVGPKLAAILAIKGAGIGDRADIRRLTPEVLRRMGHDGAMANNHERARKKHMHAVAEKIGQ